jgi:hypothetical protein
MLTAFSIVVTFPECGHRSVPSRRSWEEYGSTPAGSKRRAVQADAWIHLVPLAERSQLSQRSFKSRPAHPRFSSTACATCDLATTTSGKVSRMRKTSSRVSFARLISSARMSRDTRLGVKTSTSPSGRGRSIRSAYLPISPSFSPFLSVRTLLDMGPVPALDRQAAQTIRLAAFFQSTTTREIMMSQA